MRVPSDGITASSSTDDAIYNSNGSIETSFSLQTLPSLPSLQTLSPNSADDISVACTSTASLKPLPSPVSFLSVNEGFLYATSDDAVHVLDAQNYAILHTFRANNPSSGSVKSVAFCNNKVLTAHQDCKIRVWKLTEDKGRHKPVATIPTLDDRFRRSILPRNYVSVRRHKKRLWIHHNDAVSGLVTSGKFIYSISWDKCMKVWRASDFRCVESIRAHDDAINAVVSSSDGLIYTGSADHRIKIWRRPSSGGGGERKHALVATLERHKSAVNALALNGDGSVLFSGACDRSILVWEKDGSARHMSAAGALRGHSKAILCLMNTADLLFSGSADGTVRIWGRGSDGKFCCFRVLDGHHRPVRSLVASRGGSEPESTLKVVTGTLDGEIKVWDVLISSQSSNPLSLIIQ